MRLSASGIHARLGGNDVLHGVDLAIEQGESVAIVGPNGSGKSTLVRTLSGVLRPASGTVRLDGSALRAMKPRERAASLGLLSQAADIPGFTTVREHIALGRFARRPAFARQSSDDLAAIEIAEATCEVSHLIDRRMEDLSGGERQRVRLATLLAQDPGILLLDEPLTGLDVEHQLGLVHLLERLNAEGSRTVVCVLHDLTIAVRSFKRLVVVHEGRIVADGPPRVVLTPGVFSGVFGVHGEIVDDAHGHTVVVCQRRGVAVTSALHAHTHNPGLNNTIPADPVGSR